MSTNDKNETGVLTRRNVMIGGAGIVVGVAAGLGIGLMGGDSPVAIKAAVNTLSGDLAIKGHDPVAYFDEGCPVMGNSAYRTTHEGALYQFVSAQGLDRFERDPGDFAPAYGGYRSYGVRLGMKFDIDPTAFEIVDGRLYLQLDPGTRHVWLQDRDENIIIANQIWREIREVEPQSLPISM